MTRYSGYWNEDGEWIECDWFEYDVHPVEFTVYYDDLTVESYMIWDDYDFSLWYNAEQSGETPWGVLLFFLFVIGLTVHPAEMDCVHYAITSHEWSNDQ